MEQVNMTREELWARQHLDGLQLDYSIWERHKIRLCQWSQISRSCLFVVDVHKCRYAFASSDFVELLGYDRDKIETLEHQGDYLESRIHPDDLGQMVAMQVKLGHFMYNLPVDDRCNYRNIYGFRVLNAKNRYVRVTSRQQVLEKDNGGKAWLILGVMDLDPVQDARPGVECTVQHLKSGETFSPVVFTAPSVCLTPRELQVLQLMQKGLLSKEIAGRLSVSIHTVNIHRQRILRKMGVQNAIEAINYGREAGIL